jgi:hypothetical protein
VALSPLRRWVTFVSLVRLLSLARTRLIAYVRTEKGGDMSKRLTPIERAIAGEPVDRKQRYMARLRKRGVTRVSVFVPEARADELRDLARRWVAEQLRHDD